MTKEERVVYRKEYYQKNKEKEIDNAKRYRENHPEMRKNGDKIYNYTIKGRLNSYICSARNRGLMFKLDWDYFEKNWNKKCYYCGDNIDGIGLDRVNNNVGYKENNVVLCCEMCNRMKLNYNVSDFLNQCIKISNNIINKALK